MVSWAKFPKSYFLGITPFSSWVNTHYDIERGLQKRHFCSFSEKGEGSRSPGPPICAPKGLHRRGKVAVDD